MDRMRRLTSFWNWLPAFRAVAENEHMTRAARQLGVTTSALSRSISLLEQELGVELFTRTGSHIALSQAGAEFLVEVRNAMRLIDDGLNAVQDEGLSGPIRIASEASFAAAFVLPGLVELREHHPRLLPQLKSPVSGLERALLNGTLDLAFACDLLPHPELTIERLATSPNGVYVAPDHPLASIACSFEAVACYPAVARFPGPTTIERWPAELRRRVALHVDDLDLAIHACASSGLVAVLPDLLVACLPAAASLQRLSLPALEPSGLFALHREPLRPQSSVELVVSAVRGVAQGAAAALKKSSV
jgi:DNA-binding transcriptional LysR family regulator